MRLRGYFKPGQPEQLGFLAETLFLQNPTGSEGRFNANGPNANPFEHDIDEPGHLMLTFSPECVCISFPKLTESDMFYLELRAAQLFGSYRCEAENNNTVCVVVSQGAKLCEQLRSVEMGTGGGVTGTSGEGEEDRNGILEFRLSKDRNGFPVLNFKREAKGFGCLRSSVGCRVLQDPNQIVRLPDYKNVAGIVDLALPDKEALADITHLLSKYKAVGTERVLVKAEQGRQVGGGGGAGVGGSGGVGVGGIGGAGITGGARLILKAEGLESDGIEELVTIFSYSGGFADVAGAVEMNDQDENGDGNGNGGDGNTGAVCRLSLKKLVQNSAKMKLASTEGCAFRLRVCSNFLMLYCLLDNNIGVMSCYNAAWV